MKKYLSFLLVFVLLFACVPAMPVANAATFADCIQGETQAWSLDEDNAFTVSGAIVLAADITVDLVVLKPGASLDLNGYTLTANAVVVFNGGLIFDGGAACTGGGLLKVAKGNLTFAKNNGDVIPLWNGVDGYVFTKVSFQEMARAAGQAAAQYIFLPNMSNPEATALLTDGGADNGFKMKVSLVWSNGQTQQLYTYEDGFVEQVFASGGRLVFSLTITGIAGITDMAASAVIVTDSGAQAAASGKTVVSG